MNMNVYIYIYIYNMFSGLVLFYEAHKMGPEGDAFWILYIYIYIHTHMYMNMYMLMYMFMYVYLCTYTYTYMCIYIYIYIYSIYYVFLTYYMVAPRRPPLRPTGSVYIQLHSHNINVSPPPPACGTGHPSFSCGPGSVVLLHPCALPLPRHMILVVYKYTLIVMYFPPPWNGTTRFRGSVLKKN